MYVNNKERGGTHMNELFNAIGVFAVKAGILAVLALLGVLFATNRLTTGVFIYCAFVIMLLAWNYKTINGND